MIDRKIVSARLSHIRESLVLLCPLMAVNADEYSRNPDCYLKAERLVEIISQAMIDLCADVVAARGLPKADTYHGLVDVLADHGVISEKLRSPIQGLFGLRNILAHQYLAIDRPRFQREVQAGLSIVETFCSEIAALVPPE